jgi:dCMP deaminase
MTRPSWDQYFIEIMNAVAKRATCDRGRSGCVIARDKQLLVAGYVGSPIGFKHCDDVGHDFSTAPDHCTRTVHAEQNAICQAARLGISINGATLYCRMTPCKACAMMIINCGIVRVVCQHKYQVGPKSETMLKDAGIEVLHINDKVLRYD